MSGPSRLRPDEPYVSIPKFRFENQLALKKIWRRLWDSKRVLQIALTCQASTAPKICLSNAVKVHAACIDVNEEATEAAAAEAERVDAAAARPSKPGLSRMIPSCSSSATTSAA